MGVDMAGSNKRRVYNLLFKKAGALEEDDNTLTLQAGVHERLHRVFNKYAQASQDQGLGPGTASGRGSKGGSGSSSAQREASADELRFLAKGQVAYLSGTNTPTSSGLRNNHIIRVSRVSPSPSVPSHPGAAERSSSSSRSPAAAPAPSPARASAAGAGSPREAVVVTPPWDMPNADWQIKKVEDLKSFGTACYKDGRLLEAIVWYSRGIVLAPRNFVLYSNRSAALLELHKINKDKSKASVLVDRMVYDAEVCMLVNPTWDKAHYRMGTALTAKGSSAEAQVCFRNALKCNAENADSREKLSASIERIGPVQDHVNQPLIGTARRAAYEAKRSKALKPFEERTAEILSWAEGRLRREQEDQERAQAQAEGSRDAQNASRKAKAQKESPRGEGGHGASMDVARGSEAEEREESGEGVGDEHQGAFSSAGVGLGGAKAWASWVDGKPPQQAAQWLIDCFRLRESDDWLGPNAHFHYETCMRLSTLPLLIFCKLAVRKKVLPPQWNWGVFFSKCSDRSGKSSVLKKLSRPEAEKLYGARVVGTSFNAAGTSMIAVAEHVYGCKVGEAWPSTALVTRDDVSTGFYRWLKGRGALESGHEARGKGKEVEGEGAGRTLVFKDVGGEAGWAEVHRKDTKDPKPCQCESFWEDDMVHLLDEFYGGT